LLGYPKAAKPLGLYGLLTRIAAQDQARRALLMVGFIQRAS